MHGQRPSIDLGSAADPGSAAGEVTCRQFVELVTDYFEGALRPATLSRVEEHLVMCDWCVDYLAQYGTTVNLLRDLRAQMTDDEPPPALLAAVRARRDLGP